MAIDVDKIKQRNFTSKTVGTRDEDGYWKVIIYCDELIVTNEGEELTKEISFMGIDRIFHGAHGTALKAYESWMQSFVYSKDTDSIIEGSMIEESMKQNANKTQINSPTTA
jgi:hypothetical protein